MGTVTVGVVLMVLGVKCSARRSFVENVDARATIIPATAVTAAAAAVVVTAAVVAAAEAAAVVVTAAVVYATTIVVWVVHRLAAGKDGARVRELKELGPWMAVGVGGCPAAAASAAAAGLVLAVMGAALGATSMGSLTSWRTPSERRAAVPGRFEATVRHNHTGQYQHGLSRCYFLCVVGLAVVLFLSLRSSLFLLLLVMLFCPLLFVSSAFCFLFFGHTGMLGD